MAAPTLLSSGTVLTTTSDAAIYTTAAGARAQLQLDVDGIAAPDLYEWSVRIDVDAATEELDRGEISGLEVLATPIARKVIETLVYMSDDPLVFQIRRIAGTDRTFDWKVLDA